MIIQKFHCLGHPVHVFYVVSLRLINEFIISFHNKSLDTKTFLYIRIMFFIHPGRNDIIENANCGL